MATTKLENDIAIALEALYPVPAYIAACAGAVRHDLLYGPCFAAVPKEGIEAFTEDHYATLYEDLVDVPNAAIEEVYVGRVAEALRAFINDLPADLWFDADCGCIMESEPEAWFDDEAEEWVEPYTEATYKLDWDDIVKALFGKTIAREFS